MTKENSPQFECHSCKNPIKVNLSNFEETLSCRCGQEYQFKDPSLKRQLMKFAALCEAIKDAEEILSDTQVGIDIGEHHVEIPYKLLLTRLNTTLDLNVGGKPIRFTFRIEPLTEEPK
jgi:hypothetical protein